MKYRIKDWALLVGALIGGSLLIAMTTMIQWSLIGFMEAHPWPFVVAACGLFWWAYRHPRTYQE